MNRQLLILSGVVVLLMATGVLPANAAGPQGKEKDKPKIFKSPREVFEAVKQAAKKNDKAAFLRCVAQVDYMAVKYTIGAFMGIGMRRIASGNDKDADTEEKQLWALLAKHGLTEAHWEKLNTNKEMVDKVTNSKTDPND